MVYTLSMWTILALFIPLTTLALDTGEQMRNVKIVKVLPENIVVFDRGLEDGLSRNDHVMLMKQNEGYASRALCLKADLTESYWKIYRVPHQEAFSKDFNYVLTGIADKEIPLKIAELKDQFFTFSKEQKGEFKIEADVPESLSSAVEQLKIENQR